MFSTNIFSMDLPMNSIDDVKKNKIGVIAFQIIAVMALGALSYSTFGLYHTLYALMKGAASILFLTPIFGGLHVMRMESISTEDQSLKGYQRQVSDAYKNLLKTEKEIYPGKEFTQPRLYLDRSSTINAYAMSYFNPYAAIQSYYTGKKEPYYVEVIVVNEGLLKKLEQNNNISVSGILAHELGHIRNKDSLLRYLPAAVDSLLTVIENMLAAKQKENEKKQPNNEQPNNEQRKKDNQNYDLKRLGLYVLKSSVNMFVNLFASRVCEYMADNYAVELGEGESLKSGLKAIEGNSTWLAKYTPVLLSTHPKTDERIKMIDESMRKKEQAIRP